MTPAREREIWRHAKPLLLPYDGMASQLHVLDLPLATLEATIERFASAMGDPTVTTLDSYSDAPQPLTPDLRARMLSHTEKNTYHRLAACREEREHVALELCIYPISATYDAEIVFWADELFPEPEDEAACFRTFQYYLALAESMRSQSPHSECVLDTLETGDPRPDRGSSSVFSW